MIQLNNLKNTSRPVKKVQRVGRGPGSKRGKTSCRGEKGDGSRSGYKRRFGYEGGNVPLFRKIPTRGFSRARFKKPSVAINLSQIEALYSDKEVVSIKTLQAKGYANRKNPGLLKVLGAGELTKKVSIEAHSFSDRAQEKLKSASISFKILEDSIESNS